MPLPILDALRAALSPRPVSRTPLLGALVALLAAAPALAQRTGSIAGTVRNAANQAPIAGATVSGASKSTTTNSAGKYTLSSVVAGKVDVSVSAAGYQSKTVQVGVRGAQTATLNVSLLPVAPSSGAVTGIVTNAITGAPLAGASVQVSGSALKATTGADGSYLLSGIAAGARTLVASATNYGNVSKNVSVSGGATATLHFGLTRTDIPAPGSTIEWNGTRTFLLGLNLPWANYATDFGTGGWSKFTNWSDIRSKVATLPARGGRLIRWWVFGDGRYSPDWNPDGTVAGLDSSVLNDIDQALRIAEDTDVYLLLTLMDFSMWTPAQWYGSVQMGGRPYVISNPTVKQTYLDRALKPLLQHIAASPYKKRVLGYDIINEPEYQIKNMGGGVNLELAQVKQFVQECVQYIHTYSGGGLATVGCAVPWWTAQWKGLGLDFYQFHYYPWMDFTGGGNPPGLLGVPPYSSLGLDKPCILGEYPSACSSYGLNDTNAYSARWYLDLIYSRGYAGALTWSGFNPDPASNWGSFAPVMGDWFNRYAPYVGPR